MFKNKITVNSKRIYIMSIDGGGIKGILAARFLKRLEDNLDTTLHDKFDMFAGTSTGSFITSAIAYKKMSADYIVNDLYSVKNASRIMNKNIVDRLFSNFQFRPKYDGYGKRELIGQYFKKNDMITNTKKNVMIVGFNVTLNKPKIFKSWDYKYKNTKVIDALDISSAAPTYFPSVYNKNYWGIDGAVCCNSPSDSCYADSLKLYGKDCDIRLLSIGTGISYPINNYSTCNWGGIQWFTRGKIIDLLLNGPQHCSNYRMDTFSKILNHKYLRINIPLENNTFDDVSQHNIQVLNRMGDLMWDKNYKKIIQFFN